MADKFKEVAVGEADRLKQLATDAARSGAYLYPIRVCSVICLAHLQPFTLDVPGRFETK